MRSKVALAADRHRSSTPPTPPLTPADPRGAPPPGADTGPATGPLPRRCSTGACYPAGRAGPPPQQARHRTCRRGVDRERLELGAGPDHLARPIPSEKVEVSGGRHRRGVCGLHRHHALGTVGLRSRHRVECREDPAAALHDVQEVVVHDRRGDARHVVRLAPCETTRVQLALHALRIERVYAFSHRQKDHPAARDRARDDVAAAATAARATTAAPTEPAWTASPALPRRRIGRTVIGRAVLGFRVRLLLGELGPEPPDLLAGRERERRRASARNHCAYAAVDLREDRRGPVGSARLPCAPRFLAADRVERDQE